MSGPSFTEFFNDQQAQRQSSGESSLDINLQEYGYHNQLASGRQVVEEPRSFDRRDSNASIHSAHRRQGSASSVHARVGALRGDADVNRKESLPFDPESSSTLISTAAGANQPRNNIGDIMFGTAQQQRPQQPQQSQHVQQPSQLYQNFRPQAQGQQYPYTPPTAQQDFRQWNGQQQFDQYPGAYNTAQSPFLAAGTPQTDNGTTPSTDAFMLDQQSPYTAATFSSGMQSAGDWSRQFLGQENGSGIDSIMWTDASANGDGILGIEDPLAELERILTNSQAGSVQPSRESTPFQPDISAAQPSPFAPDPNFTQAFESTITSRSTSPYPQASTSNTMPNPINAQNRRSPSPNHSSPFFNKPQSPPALIIPNQQHSPSPVLPPIVTSTEQNNIHQTHQSHGGTGLGGVSGGLFPPANPALEGLTGMAGISPIGPNADGPMIYIQPSTPISGLKDGRGVFDFKGVTHGQQNHAQQGQQNQNAGFSVPPPQGHTISRHSSHDALDQLAQSQASQHQQSFTNGSDQAWPGSFDWSSLKPNPGQRPRAKSDSQTGVTGSDILNRQGFVNPGVNLVMPLAPQFSIPSGLSEDDLRAAIDNWRMATLMQAQSSNAMAPTVDPRALPGQEAQNLLSEFKLSQQFAQLQAQKNRLPPLNTTTIKHATGGQISPTSMAFYQQLGIQPQSATQLGTNSAPFYQTTFSELPQTAWPHTAGPTQTFLMPDQGGIGPRRRSFAEGTNHAAVGLGTPGYGVEFTRPSPFGTLDPGRVKGTAAGHRRTAKSEDLGRPGGTGWGVGAGGTTADFLNSITANDGTLLPPSRGRSHSRQSSASSARSASPALSVSSQGSSFSNASPGRMDMPEGVQVPKLPGQTARKRVAKMKVTSVATEVASTSRRTNDGVFKCPVPGCGSTFTRHFNLKGHLRSHNDERPYKCLYDGCPKATVGFARQHDCKRHMLLHEGLRPFECEGCGKKFARLDALTRHHKSEQGQECAITHPLPTNPDGTPMSESQYKAYRAAQHNLAQQQQAVNVGNNMPFSGDGGGRLRREASFQSYLSADDRSGAEDDLGTGSGMDDYDQF